MVRNNTTLVALCAIILSLVVVNDSWGQVPITNRDIYEDLLANPIYTPPVDQNEFEGDENGDLFFPPPYEGEWGFVVGDQHLPDGTYTLNLTDGRTFTFTGSLIIQETEYEEDETVGVGRIQALGEAGNMVTLDEAVLEEGWGGIVIQTDPEDGNLIDYCVIINVAGSAVVINSSNQDASAQITNCVIHDAGIGIRVWKEDDDVDFVIQNNEIYDCAPGIHLGVAGEQTIIPENADAIVNNVVYNNAQAGMDIHCLYEGNIRNNLIYHNTEIELLLERPVTGLVANNTIIGDDGGEWDRGIWCNWAWSEGIKNNIIANCGVGIQGNDDEDDDFDYCILFNAPVQDCDPGPNCIIGDGEDEDPQFVNDVNDDYHLLWESPAINAGVILARMKSPISFLHHSKCRI